MKKFVNILTIFCVLSLMVCSVIAAFRGDVQTAWHSLLAILGIEIIHSIDRILHLIRLCLDSLMTLLNVAKLENLKELVVLEELKYTEADLVKFGQYLLSEQREQSIENKDNLREVHDRDLANWRE